MKGKLLFVQMISMVCLACSGGCKNNVSTPRSEMISIDGGMAIVFDYSEASLLGVGKMIIWEKDGGRLLWALSGIDMPERIEYGKMPEPKRSRLGYIKTPARQLYPKNGASPIPPSEGVGLYILFEVSEDTVLGSNLDLMFYEAILNGDNNEYNIKKIKPFRTFPDEVEALWN